MTTEERLTKAVKRVSDKIRFPYRAVKECGVNIRSIYGFKCGCCMDMNLSTVYIILSRYINGKMPIPSQDEFSTALKKASKAQMKSLYLDFGSSIYKISSGIAGIKTDNACRLADVLKKEGLL